MGFDDKREFEHTLPTGEVVKVISQAEAAVRCNMSRQNFFARLKHAKEPFDWVTTIDGKTYILSEKKSFLKFSAIEKKATHREKTLVKYKEKGGKSKSASAVMNRIQKSAQAAIIARGNNETGNPADDAVYYAALVEKAKNEQEISKAAIAKEKAIQAQVQTLEKLRHVAPIEVMRFYFSFAENMIMALYRRPHEIEAELEALFLSGQKKQATEKLIREMEGIVKNSVAELTAAMEKESYKLKEKKA